ncbi:MAG TPA: phosphogluconate dehydratase, partial [Burkholderiaceae bacterium]
MSAQSAKPVHAVIAKVTARIIEKSRVTREAYLQHIEAARRGGVHRGTLSCTNLAHGFAAFSPSDKLVLKEQKRVSVAIVSAYNDMLSAHQP